MPYQYYMPYTKYRRVTLSVRLLGLPGTRIRQSLGDFGVSRMKVRAMTPNEESTGATERKQASGKHPEAQFPVRR